MVPREGFPAADERGMHFGGGGLAIAVAADQSAIAEDERDLGLRPAAGEEERAVVPDRPEGRGAAVEGDGPGGGRQAARRGQGDAALGELKGPAIVIVRCGHDGGMSGCTGRETGEAVGIKSQPGGRGTGPRENYDGAAKADKGEPAESPSPDRHLHILQLYISQRKHRSPNCSRQAHHCHHRHRCVSHHVGFFKLCVPVVVRSPGSSRVPYVTISISSFRAAFLPCRERPTSPYRRDDCNLTAPDVKVYRLFWRKIRPRAPLARLIEKRSRSGLW